MCHELPVNIGSRTDAGSNAECCRTRNLTKRMQALVVPSSFNNRNSKPILGQARCDGDAGGATPNHDVVVYTIPEKQAFKDAEKAARRGCHENPIDHDEEHCDDNWQTLSGSSPG